MALLNRLIKLAVLCFIYKVTSVYADDGTENEIFVKVNGSDNSTECFKSTQGCSVVAAFQAVTSKKRFQNSTIIKIASGDYTLNTNFTFEDIESLTITKVGNASASIRCSGNRSGLAFLRCRSIAVLGISLLSCGTLQQSASKAKPLFYSALFVKNTKNFKLQGVVVQKSLGIGVTMYDTTGDVTIDTVIFENNGPDSLKCDYEDARINKSDGIAKAGGGLYIEFTNESDEQLKNSNYYVKLCKFRGNVAPYSELVNNTFKRPGGVNHIGFSRGGGLSIYMRGSASSNKFLIDSCVFENNHAIWGGGYFIQFLDAANGNQFKIINTNVTRNTACLGGGAFQLSTVSSSDGFEDHLEPNHVQSSFCVFSNNSAVSGGGGTIFGRTSMRFNSSYDFEHCTWKNNKATIGFALTLKLYDYDQGLFGPHSPFKVNLLNCNISSNFMRNVSIHGWGIGTVYDFLVPLNLTNVHFVENTNTSLILDTSSVQVHEDVTFSRNSGYKGGAVAMYGEASFLLKKGSRLTFDGNIAKEVGGAVFVETPGPESLPVVTSNYLQTHECFFKYEDSGLHPDDWKAQVVFIENKAPAEGGYSVYSNSLRDCLHHGDRIADVLEWKSFHYYRRNSSNGTRKHEFEIATDAINITSRKLDWMVSPAQSFSPHVTLLDEKNHSVYGMVHISIKSKEPSTVALGTPSPLFLVKDKIPFLDLKGICGANFSVEFRTVGGQFAQERLENLVLAKCNPGFLQKGKECVCASIEKERGISRCNENRTVVILEKGYWAGEVKDENGETQFVTAQCPTGYCDCPKPEQYSLRADECVYNKDEICLGNRKGVLCGSCEYGYSVQVGNEVCSAACENSDLWRLAPLLIGLTVLVFVIFLVNLDVFTCYLNVWLYFYQVVKLVLGVHEEIRLDPFIEFVIGLAQVTISGFGSCMWKGMDNLQKLGFSYLLPVYVFIVVFIISVVARRFPNSYFARNSTFRASCTLLVLCYSTLARVSMSILRPSKVGDDIVVFYEGTVKYFSSYHNYFTVPALLVLLFIVIPFPFILMFSPFFIKHVRMVVYANPLFNTFQSCFKDKYRWYAAFYFFSRFIFLLFSTFIPYGGVKALFMQVSCVFVLTAHVYHWPYLEKYNRMNQVDSVLLTTLTVISIVAAQMTKNISVKAKNNLVTIVDALAYIPLAYAVIFAAYMLWLWVKPKLRPPEQSMQSLGNVDDPHDSASVRVV